MANALEHCWRGRDACSGHPCIAGTLAAVAAAPAATLAATLEN